MADKRIGKRIKTSRGTSEITSYSISELFTKFIFAKQAEGRSKGTISQTKQSFSYFMDFLREEKGLEANMDVRNVTVDILREYVVYMIAGKVKYSDHKFKKEQYRTTGLAPSTINTRMKGLRVFFGWLQDDERTIDMNPTKNIKHVREPEEDIEVMNPDQIKALFAIPTQRTYAGFRDYVIMNLLLDSMIRINELMNLKVGDFNAQTHTITIAGATAKTRKYRVIPISPSTVKLLQELIEENSGSDQEYFFLANYGSRLDAGQVRNRLKQFGKEAKIPFNVHPHLFRHTGATLFLENGGSERMLQMILGHANLRLISRYTHPSRKAVQAQHERYSPLLAIQSAQNQPRRTLRDTAV